MNGGPQVLRLEVLSDAQAFAARVDELAGLALSPVSSDPNLLARAAVALHHAYGAFESALARVAKVFDTEPKCVAAQALEPFAVAAIDADGSVQGEVVEAQDPPPPMCRVAQSPSRPAN